MLQKIRELSKHLAIYGAGDVAIQALNFLLLPFYVRYLTQADYGVLALLASVEADRAIVNALDSRARFCIRST